MHRPFNPSKEDTVLITALQALELLEHYLSPLTENYHIGILTEATHNYRKGESLPVHLSHTTLLEALRVAVEEGIRRNLISP